MKYKLIALDLDGTLLNSRSHISPYTAEVLKDLDRRGIYIIIATGRSYLSLKPKIEQLHLEHPVICFNGGMIRDGKSDEILMSTTVPEEVTRELILIARRNNIHFQGFIKGDFYYERVSEFSKLYQQVSGLEGILSDFDNFKKFSFTKCMLIGDNASLQEIEPELRAMFKYNSYIAFSKPTFLEIMNVGASKSKALNIIASEYGIDREEIIAFGDGLNDQDMLEYAGKGVVMKNGYDSLKSQFENSKYTNDEDGVARYLKGLLDE